MPQKYIRNLLPSNKILEKAGFKDVRTANLHINRKRIVKAVLIGLFIAFIPIPFQMVVAGFLAVIFHANLPLSIVLVWITNPLTMPIIFYFEYYLGTIILQHELTEFEASLEWIEANFELIYIDLYVGSFFLATIISLSGYIIVNRWWIYKIVKSK